MNRFLFTFCIILFFCFSVTAQTSSRLILATKGRYNPATGKYDYAWDTTRYTYSWGRGGNLNSTIMFDSCIRKNPGYTNVITATYDNLNRLKTLALPSTLNYINYRN